MKQVKYRNRLGCEKNIRHVFKHLMADINPLIKRIEVVGRYMFLVDVLLVFC